MKIQGLGCEKYNDGFDVNDEFIKGKIIEIVSPDEQQLSLIMHFMDSKKEMTPDDLISFYVANENRVAQENQTRELGRGMKSPNLALKAKAIHLHEEEVEEEVEDSQEEEMTSTSELDVDLAFFTKKWGRSFGRKVGNFSKDVRRNCYNCDQPGHFSDKCPYEKREDKPKYDK